jgi:hypothetical protein
MGGPPIGGLPIGRRQPYAVGTRLFHVARPQDLAVERRRSPG